MAKEKNLLGICAGGPSGAALFQNGELIFAVNEERFSGIKLDRAYPHQSISWCLNEAGLSTGDVNKICYGFSTGVRQGEFMASMIKRLHYYSEDPRALKIICDRLATEAEIDTSKRNQFYEETGKMFPGTPVYACAHHQAHQASAYMASPFENALVVTSDGRGDFESVTVSTASPEGIKPIYSAFSWESLGYFYGRITHLCGFKPERHEGKVLGLSAHGNPELARGLVEKMVGLKDGKVVSFPGDFYTPFFTNYSPKLLAEASKFSREDLAAAAQLKLEEIVSELVSKHVEESGLRNICLAGGVFTNVKLNQRLRELPGVDDVFIYPNMGDDGLCAGAVYHKLLHEDRAQSKPIKSLYLGPKISNRVMLDSLRDKGFRIEESNQLGDRVVELLERQETIALVQGRTEFGPRALGNRSILLTPDSVQLSTSLNHRLGRNDFMPFAPVIASNLAARCLKGYSDSQFSARHMVITYTVTQEFKENSPAVVHVDETVRPQVVFREDNPFLFELLNNWHDRTGKLCLINTSYNLHENPIASLERDVISSFEADAVDHLLFPPYLAHQKGK